MKNPVVLLVEDDPDQRDMYGRILWYNRFDVLNASNGEDAIDMARKHRPDLIVLDLGLPGMGGIEVCYALKKDRQTTHIPIIVLTAYPEHRLQAQQAGCAAYLVKPQQPIALVHEVARLIGWPHGGSAPRSESTPPTS